MGRRLGLLRWRERLGGLVVREVTLGENSGEPIDARLSKKIEVWSELQFTFSVQPDSIIITDILIVFISPLSKMLGRKDPCSLTNLLGQASGWCALRPSFNF
ncbi:hypothetical protein BEST7613_2942 [Synechocystis sp. PCC 6803]|nr:hypothetical protein BEST7613_2942 [Synechocystis sp. PCC 6803] [Bacillus subtilis BEST7613]